MNNIFVLTSTDSSGIGGYTYIIYTKYFNKMEDAKRDAEEDYGELIKWSRGKYNLSSGDLGYVMYTIKREKVL